MARRVQEFQTIRSEGGLLPPDLLRRVIDPRGSLKGTRPEDYGLPQGERLSEVITQSWNRLRRHWGEFRAAAAKLPEGEAGTGLSNDKWSLPLLRELGFGLLPTSASPEIAGRTYAISRFFGSVPIHLVGCGLSLDRRAAGVRGAAGGNPHGLVQEVLNRSPDHLWGIVGNGLRLRILRDNQALSRQSFLEFDLEAMFSAEAYSDFVLLWLVAHATRFAPRDGNRIESCWLEEWTKEAQEQGTRALTDLRGSVERALQVLGEGFTSHPKNTALCEALRSGSLPLADFHGQLLRVVYRLIFLFVAEDRTLEGQALLHPRDDSEAARVARERYAAHYGTSRLRDLAGKIKGSRHGDLWRQFQILVGALSGVPSFEGTRRTLALPALGSFLWSPGSTAALNGAELTNHDFLEALRHLAFTRQGKVLRPVDYRNLGAEELGGVYESLLALTPQISADGAHFTFAEFAGNERKTSGSYYTPDSLVQCLLDSALDPVVEEAIKGKAGAEAEQAILGLKVCDPAVGSGHFLVGAAHRLARHLARVRAQTQGESEPSPLLYQHALRDLIGRCLYGVDLNPMAAELCRVSLWLEALEPGKPLSFLDHHIRVGNSLLGATPELIAAGVPDDAFTAIESDDKKACAVLKKRNKADRKGLGPLFAQQDAETQALLQQAAAALEELPDDRPEDIRAKELAFRRHEETEEYRRKKRLADTWCAAFVIKKHFLEPGRDASASGITQGHLGNLASGQALPADLAAEAEHLADLYQFFHWHLAFPEVFAKGGFDCVLGNPPWEKLKLMEVEFFAVRAPEIAKATTQAQRRKLLSSLKASRPELFEEWQEAVIKIDRSNLFIRSSSRFYHTAVGELNTYALFSELALSSCCAHGRTGIIVKSSLITADTYGSFFQHLAHEHLVSAYDFKNWALYFADVGFHERYTLLTLERNRKKIEHIRIGVEIVRVDELMDPDKTYTLTSDELSLFSPISGTCPLFRNRKEKEIARYVYDRFSVLVPSETDDNPWRLKYVRLFDMSSSSNLFETKEELNNKGGKLEAGRFHDGTDVYAPLYEGKYIKIFNHRFSSYEGILERVRFTRKAATTTPTLNQLQDPFYEIEPRYWIRHGTLVEALKSQIQVRDYYVLARLVTNVISNNRSTIACVSPAVACNNLALILYLDEPNRKRYGKSCLIFTGLISSFVFDFITRLKMSENLLKSTLFEIATPRPDILKAAFLGSTFEIFVLSRSAELTCVTWSLEALLSDIGADCPPFHWDEERRFLLRCELDAAFFHLYLPSTADGQWKRILVADGASHEGSVENLAQLKSSFPTPRAAIAYIMNSFPIVQSKEEEKYGEYRTKRVILEMYDAMQEANRAGQPYQTRLDPPPGPPQDADGKFIPYAQIAGNPPPHIHLPRGAVAGGGVTLQLSDLAARFPPEAFLLRLSARGDAKPLRVRPMRTADIQAPDRVVLASAKLRNAGKPVPAAIGKLHADARTDASDGSAYVLVTVRGENGTAQARFSEDEWCSLTTIGVVEDGTRG